MNRRMAISTWPTPLESVQGSQVSQPARQGSLRSLQSSELALRSHLLQRYRPVCSLLLCNSLIEVFKRLRYFSVRFRW